MKEFIIEKNEENQRLDRFLSKYLDKAPKSLIQKYIRKKKVKVNKKKQDPSYILQKDDKVNIYIYDEVLSRYISKVNYKIYAQSLNYLYQDDNIAIIVKDFGWLMHGEGKSLVNLFISDLIKAGDFKPDGELSFVPSFSNRLDRNTKGLVVGCKNAEALRLVNKAFKDRNIDKGYKALVKGEINGKITINDALEYGPNNTVSISKSAKAKDSLTIVHPVRKGNNYSLIEIDLVTGRKHQIRVHLSHIGHPILGDKKYGQGEDLTSYGLKGQYLIANKLTFKEMDGLLSYLSGKEFILDDKQYEDLENVFLNT